MSVADKRRRIDLAEWHLRESFLCSAAGRHAYAASHLATCREYVQLAGGFFPSFSTDELTGQIEQIKDSLPA